MAMHIKIAAVMAVNFYMHACSIFVAIVDGERYYLFLFKSKIIICTIEHPGATDV
jgi:hypothetical protein